MVKPEPATPDSAKIEVIDIANFGSPIEQNEFNFRWAPDRDYLQQLGEPLRLT